MTDLAPYVAVAAAVAVVLSFAAVVLAAGAYLRVGRLAGALDADQPAPESRDDPEPWRQRVL